MPLVPKVHLEHNPCMDDLGWPKIIRCGEYYIRKHKENFKVPIVVTSPLDLRCQLLDKAGPFRPISAFHYLLEGGGMVCCSLGWFSILFFSLIYWQFWDGADNMMVEVGDGVSLGGAQLVEALDSSVMAWSWESEWAVGASVRSFVSMMSPRRMRSSRVTTGVVMFWWRNSAILEICSALVSCGMILSNW